ncbi:MAG: hypothetical protein IJT83_08545 [Victivallales bacterium]|nr:hypothetical protein [Victivallales bacterium]
MMHFKRLFLFMILFTGVLQLFGGIREDSIKATKLRDKGNFSEAYDIYVTLLENPQIKGDFARMVFRDVVVCLQRLNRIGEYDALLKKALDIRKNDWQFICGLYFPEHQGYVLDGKFTRGAWNRRNGGKYIDVSYADRLFRLKLMVRNMPPVTEDSKYFYMTLANEFLDSYNASLTILTDLTEEPDYLNPHVMGSTTGGIPVDDDGNPLFFLCPKSFEEAKNDGERAVWAYHTAMKCSDLAHTNALFLLADFYNGQYGVQTIQHFLNQTAQNELQQFGDSVLSLETLEDNETIARLATGIKRFKLPDECNPILLYKQILSLYEEIAKKNPKMEPDYNWLYSYKNLAWIYENRMQLDKALVWWQKYHETIKKINEKRDKGNKIDETESEQAILAITGNWCRLDDIRKQIAGEPASIRLRFRNGTRGNFTLQPIDMDQIVADCQAYLANLKGHGNEWQQRDFTNLAWRLFQMDGGEKRYLKEKVASWTMELTPAEKHKDRTITIQVPAQKTGWYLLTCTLENGANTARAPVYFADTEIVQKHLTDGRTMWQVLDAKSGQPLANEKVEFFCWSSRWNPTSKREESDHSRFAEMTDDEGKIVKSREELFDGHRHKYGEVQLVLKNDTGRRAWFSSNNHFNGRIKDNFPEERTRAFFLTDRPVYRPGQKVEFKFWIGKSKYDYEGKSEVAGLIYNVDIRNPRGQRIKECKLTADSYGGIVGTFELPNDAMLGSYRVTMQHGSGMFRVEEYKKPEFEVTVETPKGSPMLGDTFELTVKAKYFFGAPVSEGTAKIKILRSTREATWWPVRPWDWYYGNGYWWFWADCPWYPGWTRWGCCAPRWSWYRNGFSHEAPEVVLDFEKKLEADGTVKITIDTAMAKKLFGNHDHQYEITASVTDASRREIFGNGKVTVAREPFKAYVWLNRGYGLVGDAMTATMQARTLDGSPVSGKGLLVLYRIAYNKEGVAEETEERRWTVDADAQGHGRQVFSASRAGQYRLSWTVTDAKGRSVEGAQLFTIHGPGYDGRDFRYNALELIPDKAEYAAGETVKLMVNTELSGSVVMLFVRGTQGFVPIPQILRMKGKSQIVEIPIEKKDMPNIYVEAYTMANGVLHDVIREIIVPPEKKILDVSVKPEQERSRPGTAANKAKIVLTDSQGKPYKGSVVVSVYDKSLEYISGGSNIADIRKVFWQWRRHHRLQGGLFSRWPRSMFYMPNEAMMRDIGLFGGLQFDMAINESGMGGTDYFMNVAFAPATRKMAKLGMERSEAVAEMAAGDMVMDAIDLKAEYKPEVRWKWNEPVSPLKASTAASRNGMVSPTVRSNFADTALWVASLETDENGEADIEIPMPENLSTWKIRVWAMGNGTRVGEGNTEVITTKDLIIRLEAPRFFVQTDEVVLSAIVHNYLTEKKAVEVELKLDGGCLKAKDKLKRSVTVDAGGEKRVDWRVDVVKDGKAVVQMRALTDVESDAVEQSFPVFVHGADKQVAFSGTLRQDQTETQFTLEVPKARRPETTRLEVRWSPTLAVAMLDAIPYLADYPYGCTEQTLNRFLPAAQARQVLRNLGISLADIKNARANLNAQEIGNPDERKAQWKCYARDPVFDEELLDAMIRRGLRDLTAMQCSDGGWGWFSGWGERSWPHTTAVVVQGLTAAEACKLVVPNDVLKRGIQWLKEHQEEQLRRLKLKPKDPLYKPSADNLDALVYRILCENGIVNQEIDEYLYRDKAKSLSPYSLALYGLGLYYAKQADHLADVMRNLDQFLVQDEENQTAYLNIGGNWWCWYGDEIETQAAYLKLLVLTKQRPELASRFVKYLLNNRKHATYWRSTRDTAACLDAFTAYLQSSDELNPDMTVDILLDEKVVATSKITRENLFTADLTFVADAEQLASGKHTLTIRKTGKGPLYFNAYLSYFTLEDFITKSGLEVKVERRVSKLVRQDKMADATDMRGQAVKQRVEQYKRVPLKTGDTLQSGDLLEVELIVESKNDYEYLLMEDYKAAGTEAVDLRSGYNGNEMGAYVEFRDAKVSFFLRTLPRGKHSLSYRLRAEIPGKFSALPTQLGGMYAPELRGNSDEFKLKITD